MIGSSRSPSIGVRRLKCLGVVLRFVIRPTWETENLDDEILARHRGVAGVSLGGSRLGPWCARTPILVGAVAYEQIKQAIDGLMAPPTLTSPSAARSDGSIADR